MGATRDEDVGTMGITGDLDRAAFWHDMAYKGEIGGPLALFNCKGKLINADFRLAARSFKAVFSNQTGGKWSPVSSALTGILFGADAIAKSAVRALVLDQRSSPLQGLWQ